MTATDGSAGASGAAPILPNLFDGFVTRPTWQVAGVDYGVGVTPGVTLKKPTASNLPPGASLQQGAGWQAIYIDGNNVNLSGYDLTNLTVMINADATGTVTISNCGATSGVNIRSTVDAKANLVIRNCSLDGGGMAADPNFQLIKVWCPVTLEYSFIADAPAAIYAGGGVATIRYNVMEGFGQNQGTGLDKGHANAIYIAGGGSAIDIAYNTIYSEAGPTAAYPLTGLGAAIGLFGDGGSYTNAVIDHNTLVSAFPDAASYLIGFYPTSASETATGSVTNNYVASVNGFNQPNSGAFGAFYPNGSNVQATYSGNVDMLTGKIVNGDNTETGAIPAVLGAPSFASWSPDTGVSGDGITSASALTLTGAAPAGATVKVYDGSNLLGSVVAGSNGAWSYATPTLADGAHSFTATDTLAGATSAASAALKVTVDTKAPTAPVETGDSIVNGNQVTVTGTAEASSTVKIYDGTTLVGTGVANASGVWSVTTSALSVGAHNLTATATDAAGNVSARSAPLDPVISGALPAAPSFASWSPDTGVSGDGVTSASALTLTGTAAAGATVKVYDGGSVLGSVVAGSNGAWSYATPKLGDGTHSFTATDTLAGATSAASAALKVTVDTKAPAAPVETGVTVSGSQATVTGTAEANSAVKLYDGAKLVGSGVANASGSWSLAASGLAVGAHSLTATATDAAGNVSASSAALSATVAAATTATPVNFTGLWGGGWDRVANVSGVADAYSTVKIYDGAALVGTTTASSSGKWRVSTGSLGYSTQILTAKEVNAAGAVVATSSGEAILGSFASDVLTSTKGDDVFVGAGSLDTFVFQAGFGHDLIADGGVGDTFYFAKSEFADFAHLLSHASQVGSSTVIASGSDVLTMTSTPLSSLVAGQFHFV